MSGTEARFTTSELVGLEYQFEEDKAVLTFFAEVLGKRTQVATHQVLFVRVSFYAKQQLLRKPALIDCGIIISRGVVEMCLIPTGRTRLAGNGSVAAKYIDVLKPFSDGDRERHERVGIRLPNGDCVFAFFEAEYLAHAEDPRKGAMFLIDPSMILLQLLMNEEQKNEFQTFGGRKVLYFDVLDAPCLRDLQSGQIFQTKTVQERSAEIRRMRVRADIRQQTYEEADRKWEDEMEERLAKKASEDPERPKVSKKAKQKARQAEKKGQGKKPAPSVEGQGPTETETEAEAERQHKLKQAESREREEEEARRGREMEAQRKKAEAAETKRQQAAEAASMRKVKAVLQKLQTKLKDSSQGQDAEAEGISTADIEATVEEELASDNDSSGSDIEGLLDAAAAKKCSSSDERCAAAGAASSHAGNGE